MSIAKTGPARAAPPLDAELPKGGASRAAQPGKPFVEVLREGMKPDVPRSAQPAILDRSGASRPAAPGEAVRALLARALDAEKRIDGLLAAATRGKTFSAAELLTMQSTVFRYSQTVEVISRAADRLVGAVKQTLGTQV